ncbi:MAG: hypothetical protein KGJ86_20200, partial [Chloroflexota bacterium]|nr:hypothetical protein [Chloroflexota bacterium]
GYVPMLLKRLVNGPTGAREVILECQEILTGRRRQLTPIEQYLDERLRYWRQRSDPGSRTHGSGRAA